MVRMRQEAAKRQQNAEGFGSGQEFPPSVQISCRNLCRMSCRKEVETPLAAGLAASAGRLGFLEALAVAVTLLRSGVLIRCHVAPLDSTKVQALLDSSWFFPGSCWLSLLLLAPPGSSCLLLAPPCSS